VSGAKSKYMHRWSTVIGNIFLCSSV
jgi:hypothetical protein